MPALVVRYPFFVSLTENDGPLRPEHDLLEGVDEILMVYLVLLAARGQKRRFVHEVTDVGAGHTWGCLRNLGEVDIGSQRHLACVDLEDGFSPTLVRQIDDHAAIKPARPQERPVKNIGL